MQEFEVTLKVDVAILLSQRMPDVARHVFWASANNPGARGEPLARLGFGSAEDLPGDRDSGHGLGPAGIERQVSDGF